MTVNHIWVAALIVLLLTSSVPFAARGDDAKGSKDAKDAKDGKDSKDPKAGLAEAVRRRLDKAAEDYAKDADARRKLLAEHYDAREAKARKAGDKAALDAAKRERDGSLAFNVIPPAFKALVQRSAASRKAVEAVYQGVIRQLTKEGKDAEADLVADELKRFRFDWTFDGKWKVTHDTGWTGVRVVSGPDFTDQAVPKARCTWELDGDSLVARWPNGGWERLKPDPADPNRLTGVTSAKLQATWVRTE